MTRVREFRQPNWKDENCREFNAEMRIEWVELAMCVAGCYGLDYGDHLGGSVTQRPPAHCEPPLQQSAAV